MIYELTEQIANKFVGDWVDRRTGIVKVIKRGDKRLPYAHSIPESDCTAEIAMIPHETYKSVMYMDNESEARELMTIENSSTFYKLETRLVVWLNGKKLGDASGEVSDEIIKDIQSQIKSWGTFKLNGYGSVKVKIKGVQGKDFQSVFGKYGADEDFKAFYNKPNDYLSLKLEIVFMPNCATFVAGDPTCGNDHSPTNCPSGEVRDSEGNVLFTVDSNGFIVITGYRVSGSGSIVLPITSYANGNIGASTLTEVIEAFCALNSGNDAGNAQAIANGLDAGMSSELQALICTPTPCDDATVTSVSDGDLFTIASGGEQRVDLIRIDPSVGTTVYLQITGWQSVNRSFTGAWTLQSIVQAFSDQGANESIYAQDIANGLSAAMSTALQALICSACDDANIQINGSLLTSVASGATENVVVRYETAGTVGTIVSGEVEIPDPVTISVVPRPIYIPEPFLASSANGDLKWQFDQGFHDYQKSDITGKVRRLGANPYTLHADTPNHWGTTARYTSFGHSFNRWDGSSITNLDTVDSTYDFVIVDHLHEKVILQHNVGNGDYSNFLSSSLAWILGAIPWRPITWHEYIETCLPGLEFSGDEAYYLNANLLRRNGGSSPGVAGAYLWFAEQRASNTTQAYRGGSGATREIRSKSDSSTLNEFYVIANYTPPA